MEIKEKKSLTYLDGNAIYLKAIVGIMAMQVIGMIIVAIFSGIITSSTGKNVLSLAVTMTMQGAYALVFFLFVIKKNKKLTYGVKPRPSVLAMVMSVAIAIVTMIAFISPAQAFSSILREIGFNLNTSIPLNNPIEIVLATIAVVILAPIFEELIFRGALLSGLRQKLGVLPSCLLSGIAFSLMHMNPDQTVYQFFLGFVAAYVVIMSGSIIPAMIIHSVSNLIALLIEITPLGALFSSFLTGIFSSYLVAAVSVPAIAIAGAAAIYFAGLLINKYSKKEKFDLLLKTVDIPKIEEEKKEGETIDNIEPMISDEDIIQQNGGLLGKKTAKICYIVAIVICSVMWLIVFASGFMPQVVI